MGARRWLTSMIGAVSGVCFAALAARSLAVLVITPQHWRASSAVFALICGFLAYVAIRAAISGRTDMASFQQGLFGGVGGAFVGLIIVLLSYAMFRQAARAYFAHPIGLHFSQVTMIRLLLALVGLGFGAGFALRMRLHARR